MYHSIVVLRTGGGKFPAKKKRSNSPPFLPLHRLPPFFFHTNTEVYSESPRFLSSFFSSFYLFLAHGTVHCVLVWAFFYFFIIFKTLDVLYCYILSGLARQQGRAKRKANKHPQPSTQQKNQNKAEKREEEGKRKKKRLPWLRGATPCLTKRNKRQCA